MNVEHPAWLLWRETMRGVLHLWIISVEKKFLCAKRVNDDGSGAF